MAWHIVEGATRVAALCGVTGAETQKGPAA